MNVPNNTNAKAAVVALVKLLFRTAENPDLRIMNSHQRITLSLVGVTVFLVAVISAPGSVSAQPMVNTHNQGTSVSDSFYEYNGVNWGFNFGNSNNNGSGSRSFGGFSFGTPAIPPFGGYSPNSGAQFGFARLGKNPFHFGLEMGYGSNRSLVSTGVNTTSINGIPSSIFSGVNRNFVTGYIPVVSGYALYGGFHSPYTPAVPYGYRINVHRHNGRSTGQMIRDSGHVGAHDHGHQHKGDWKLGGNHYEIYPIYGPGCGILYRYTGYGFPTYGLATPYRGMPYAVSASPYVGNYVGGAQTYYSDSFRNISTAPMTGTLAAGILQSQANAAEYWADAKSESLAKKTEYQGLELSQSNERDPLGSIISTTEPEIDRSSSSTATERPESLKQIRKRIAEEQRIETELRRAAIERLIDEARVAYRESEIAEAIELSETALERCLDEDKELKEKIVRGIKHMKAKQSK